MFIDVFFLPTIVNFFSIELSRIEVETHSFRKSDGNGWFFMCHFYAIFLSHGLIHNNKFENNTFVFSMDIVYWCMLLVW